MNLIFLCDLLDRLSSSERFKANLCFELRAVSFAFAFHRVSLSLSLTPEKSYLAPGPIFGGHFKVTVQDCQFEGGSAAISVSGGLNVNIHNNTILYANLGMEVRNSKKVRITSNNVLGTKQGEPIQVEGQAGIIAGGSNISVQGNQFLDLDLGCAIAGSSNYVVTNDWSRTKEGENPADSIVPRDWKSPMDFGPIKKGDKVPFAG